MTKEEGVQRRIHSSEKFVEVLGLKNCMEAQISAPEQVIMTVLGSQMWIWMYQLQISGNIGVDKNHSEGGMKDPIRYKGVAAKIVILGRKV